MKHHKRLLSMVLAFVLALSLGIPAFAAVEDTGFSDVDADAWYAEAVLYCREHGLMGGVGSNRFAPESRLTRAELATVLYRIEGEPAVTGTDAFTDTADGTWYSDAVLWVSQRELMDGYGNGRFGANDPVTREQIATILWRYEGSPAADPGLDFADEGDISTYAAGAVDWARANGVINGKGNNRFDPRGNATRAEVATVLMNYIQGNQPAPEPDPSPSPDPDGTRILIAYFSVPETSGVDAVAQASRVVENGQVMGNVEFIASTIREETGGDIFAIETVQTYPGEHQALLDFAAAEMAANARPALSTSIDNLDDYDVIFLGYPIWNADLPMPLYTFLDAYDLSGKTVIPFTAHGGSGFAGTISTIAAQEPGAQVERSGFSVSRNSVSAAKGDIVDWVRELGYAKPAEQPVPTPGGANVLVAYVSQTGTTRRVAQQIAEYTGGGLTEIRRAQPYGDLQTEAKAEIDNGTRPANTVDVDDLSKYEVIFIGYPIWWDEAPAMIAAFLSENDLSGKVVAPFCTSSYSSIDNSLHIFRELAYGAIMAEGLTANDQSAIRPWVDQVMAQAEQ